MLHTGYTSAKKLLMEELKQREEEGFAVPETLREKAENIPETAREESLYLEIYEKLDHLEKRMDFPFVEPDELEEIRAERPFRRLRKYPVTLSDKELLDRNHGAWLGRCVGCALGKPVESMGMSGNRWRDIRAYLKHRGDWPLSDYFSGRDAGDGLRLTCPDSQREQIRWMESDDDIRYTLIGLRIFELYGMDFTFLDIADLWNRMLPMGFCFTAERQALLNFNLLRGNPNALDRRVIRTYRNPYREWIGAQIRADFFGFAAPGNPELAAEFAWRDASWTHVKNGIYGEMFFAALASASYVVSDLRERDEFALGESPDNCRVADAVRRAL